MSITALKGLTKSRKATAFVLVVIVLGVMVQQQLLTAEQFISFLKVAFPAWALAHAGEEGAKHVGAAKQKDLIENVKRTLIETVESKAKERAHAFLVGPLPDDEPDAEEGDEEDEGEI